MSQTSSVSTAARQPVPPHVTPAISVANYGSAAASKVVSLIQGILDGQSLHDDTAARIEHVLATAARQGLVTNVIPLVFHCQQDFGCWVQSVQATLVIGGVQTPVEWTIDPDRHERLKRYGPEVMRVHARMQPRISVH